MAAVPVLKFSNGKSMPVFGLGTWQSPKGEVAEAVKAAIACGYRHIDCAWAYGNEAEVGQAIKAKIDDGTVKREDLFITTKLWNTFHRPDLVEGAMKDSLERLGLSYVDLYLMHWPVAFKEDTGESMPKDADGILILSDADYLDTWKEMELLVEKGFTKSIGVSNFNSEQLQRLLQTEGLKYAPVTNQVEVNPYILNNKLISFCREKGIAITAYSPLGSSDHPAFRSDAAFRRLFDEPSLQELGKKYGKTVAQVVLRWGLQRDTIVIPKSVTPSRIKENFQVFDFQLTEEEMNVVSALDRNFRACAFDVTSKSQYYPFHIEF
ncbi:1,5-anhydro-D-fructose reductase-like isoform X2 [Haliotis rufescens]|uniref:1,5-anhydro-D-fructose reductase-like isoform X1 n=1 Tax=Haliotis rufescens TaxID=6454 RepID=UPI001EB027E5|nr:1,5-anhydro-D-fructose reductase-like isoform X1 [Haliotis rufescens]XP_046368341.1 1,5-anhydro-D-fructose reductase-like isoform X2 [Haliotis rufescens]